MLLQLSIHLFSSKLVVDCGALAAGMAECLLEDVETGALLAAVRAEGVPETLHGGTVDAGVLQVLGNGQLDTSRPHPAPELGLEDPIVLGVRWSDQQVAPQRL